MTRRHTDWCAGGHRCDLGEHRSEEIVVDLPGRARAVLNRVARDTGGQYAELRVRVALADVDPAARRQLLTLLDGVRDLVTRTALAGRPAPHPR
ncbi:hypothetical protein [Micromonospora echinofusca]|uniref:Uncharacterized protein n=1 Tax=Micromonospora echinofusca TaxID=47858 RepID=A0ABS3VLE7_MICEH|nr:hypothetical protein [Micromonospora echinofusca]MBO4205286.1 hypothetical protein [Micromonospora echinofusca]